MARRFEILINPESGLQGNLVAIIDAGRVRRQGESTSDSPIVPTISPAIEIDTRTELAPTWDVPDQTIRGGRVEVGIEFPYDVIQRSDASLMENVNEWLTLQGLEVNGDSIRVEPIVDESFSLRLADVPSSVAHSAEFSIGVRTTFNQELTAAPTATALTLSAGTVDSVCQIIANQSYLFQCTAPASGTGDITITADASEWSVITSNYEFDTTIEIS